MAIRLLLLSLCSALVVSCASEKLVEYKLPDKTMLLGSNIGCKFENLILPENTLIYATGKYNGRELNSYIDRSNHKVTQFDIVINSPKKPVALILGAYEPSVWNIGWTKNTKILAIVAAGYHRQAVVGMTESTPLLISTYDNKSECGYGYVGSSESSKIKQLSTKIFNREPDSVIVANEGTAIIGEQINLDEKIVRSDYVTLKDIIENDIYLTGDAKLKKELKAGNIRELTKKDIDNWTRQYKNKLIDKTQEITLPGIMRNRTNVAIDDQFGRRPFTFEEIYHGYVIEKKITFPEGLYGINSATFFLKKGVPYPEGDLGHSTVFDFNTMTCNGVECEELQSEEVKPPKTSIDSGVMFK